MANLLKSKRARVAVIVGGALGIVGIALAAFLLTASISGNVSFRDQNADFRVAASGTVGDGGMDCSGTNGVDRTIRVNAAIARFTSPGQPAQVPAQRCRVDVRVENTGAVPLTVSGFNIGDTRGVAVEPISAPTTIPAGAGGDYSVNLVVAKDSQPSAGSFTGELQFTSGQ